MAKNTLSLQQLATVSIDDLQRAEMPALLNIGTRKTIVQTKSFNSYENRLKDLKETSDFITFPEVIEAVRGGLEKDRSFPHYGQEDLMKVLALGTPEWMASEGILVLGTAFVYPEQFRVREYQPDPPEDKEDEGDFYPPNALVLELRAYRGESRQRRARVYWARPLGNPFPRDTYIPRQERVPVHGTWDECFDHYESLVKRMEKMAKQVMFEGGMVRMF